MRLESFFHALFYLFLKLVQINYVFPVQKLRENNVEGIDIMQISGHKNVAFINNYSTLSEEN
jgi:hypothetical protein